MRDKYENKTPVMRFIHRNTGYITISIVVPLLIISWMYYESTQVFFESWSCLGIMTVDDESLTELESIRYHEIVEDCGELGFTP